MSFRKPIKRKIKRKKPGSGPSNVYFTEDTQNAIIEWQSYMVSDVDKTILSEEECQQKKNIREKIYKERIHNAFDALIDNLINVYGFKASFETKDDLKKECLTFLFGVLGKYDSTKSFRAFAYFNVVAKNWLTIRCKNAAKKTSVMVSIDNPDDWADADFELIIDTKASEVFDDYFEPKLTRNQLEEIIYSVKNMLKAETHKKVLDAVMIILQQTEDLDFLNKRAISLYLRDLTGMNQKDISTALSAIKKKYKTYKNIKEETIE